MKRDRCWLIVEPTESESQAEPPLEVLEAQCADIYARLLVGAQRLGSMLAGVRLAPWLAPEVPAFALGVAWLASEW